MNKEIQTRYTKESSCGSNLSCGGNIDFLNLKKEEVVLDLGCGRGDETIQAAILVGKEGKAVGLDITDAMLDAAHANAEGIGVSNISFYKSDIENLPFEECYFDAIISNCVINHARNKNKVYSEIYRVLKIGGRFVISDAVSKFPLPLEVKNDPQARAECYGGALTESEYMDAIYSQGFRNVKILKRREYLKKGFDFISITLTAYK